MLKKIRCARGIGKNMQKVFLIFIFCVLLNEVSPKTSIKKEDLLNKKAAFAKHLGPQLPRWGELESFTKNGKQDKSKSLINLLKVVTAKEIEVLEAKTMGNISNININNITINNGTQTIDAKNTTNITDIINIDTKTNVTAPIIPIKANQTITFKQTYPFGKKTNFTTYKPTKKYPVNETIGGKLANLKRNMTQEKPKSLTTDIAAPSMIPIFKPMQTGPKSTPALSDELIQQETTKDKVNEPTGLNTSALNPLNKHIKKGLKPIVIKSKIVTDLKTNYSIQNEKASYDYVQNSEHPLSLEDIDKSIKNIPVNSYMAKKTNRLKARELNLLPNENPNNMNVQSNGFNPNSKDSAINGFNPKDKKSLQKRFNPSQNNVGQNEFNWRNMDLGENGFSPSEIKQFQSGFDHDNSNPKDKNTLQKIFNPNQYNVGQNEFNWRNMDPGQSGFSPSEMNQFQSGLNQEYSNLYQNGYNPNHMNTDQNALSSRDRNNQQNAYYQDINNVDRNGHYSNTINLGQNGYNPSDTNSFYSSSNNVGRNGFNPSETNSYNIDNINQGQNGFQPSNTKQDKNGFNQANMNSIQNGFNPIDVYLQSGLNPTSTNQFSNGFNPNSPQYGLDSSYLTDGQNGYYSSNFSPNEIRNNMVNANKNNGNTNQNEFYSSTMGQHGFNPNNYNAEQVGFNPTDTKLIQNGHAPIMNPNRNGIVSNNIEVRQNELKANDMSSYQNGFNSIREQYGFTTGSMNQNDVGVMNPNNFNPNTMSLDTNGFNPYENYDQAMRNYHDNKRTEMNGMDLSNHPDRHRLVNPIDFQQGLKSMQEFARNMNPNDIETILNDRLNTMFNTQNQNPREVSPKENIRMVGPESYSREDPLLKMNQKPKTAGFNIPYHRASDILDDFQPAKAQPISNPITENPITSLQCEKPILIEEEDGDEAVAIVFKPKNISLLKFYGDLLKKITLTVLVPYHISKLTQSD